MNDQNREGANRDYGQNFSPVYERLKQEEEVSGDHKEVILIPGLDRTSLEFSHLKNSGVSSKELRNGKVSRGKLLQAGYVFLNRVGRGEKPIISADMPLTGQGQNFRFNCD